MPADGTVGVGPEYEETGDAEAAAPPPPPPPPPTPSDGGAGPEGPGNLTAMDRMAQYLSAHNYGREDYAEYCQDPEWQKLNNDLLLETGERPTAADQMYLYMTEHNYGRMDYPEYSQDPEWQRIQAAYLENPAQHIDVTPYEQRVDAVWTGTEVPPETSGETAEYGVPTENMEQTGLTGQLE